MDEGTIQKIPIIDDNYGWDVKVSPAGVNSTATVTCTRQGSDTVPVATHAPVAHQSHYALVMYGIERVERICRFGLWSTEFNRVVFGNFDPELKLLFSSSQINGRCCGGAGNPRDTSGKSGNADW